MHYFFLMKEAEDLDSAAPMRHGLLEESQDETTFSYSVAKSGNSIKHFGYAKLLMFTYY